MFNSKGQKIFIFLRLLLLLVLILFAPDPVRALGEGFVVDYNSVNSDQIPLTYLNQARQLDVFFAHKSIGENIRQGLTDLAGQDPGRYSLEIGTEQPAVWFDSHNGLLDVSNSFGTNFQPASKVNSFANLIRNSGYGSRAKVAMMKFCGVDFICQNWWGNMPAADIWDNLYRPTMEALETGFPNVTFVWWTAPLQAASAPHCNSEKKIFNDLVRSYCTSHNKILFDIAAIESHRPDGTAVIDSNGYEAMHSDYSSDSLHLNEVGRQRVAKAVWWLLARIAGWQPGSLSPTPMQTPTKTPTPVLTSEYYVSPTGNDSNNGSSPQIAWQSIAKVNSFNFKAGDTIYFEKGGVWNGRLLLHDSGTSGNPITFTSYGTGNKPVISDPTAYGRAIEIGNNNTADTVGTSWIIVDGFVLQDSQEAGIYIENGSDHNVIRNIEATRVGMGVYSHGQYSLITNNYIHDLTMIKNSPTPTSDDYGAVGVWLDGSSNSEVSYNRLVNCKAPSYDYIVDGGGVELYGGGDNNYVHHNWEENSAGFVEVSTGTFINNTLAYNVTINDHGFIIFNLGGVFTANLQNFKVENNTIVEISSIAHYAVIDFSGGVPSTGALVVKNNLFYVKNFWNIAPNDPIFTHENNLYYIVKPNGGTTNFGFTPTATEVVADPLFIDIAANNFNLQSTSPAINKGANLGYTLDFANNAVPYGSAPDIGAYEYQGAILPTSSPAPFCQTCPSGVPLKSDGNANCDSKVDLSDYTVWLGVYRKIVNNQPTTEQERAPVDFNCQPPETTHNIGLDDYVIWLRNYRGALGG